MLSNTNRLKKEKDFDQVFKKGKGFKEDFLFLKLAKNNLKATRFGFVVSQKVSKKAFLRNKIKRRLRELAKKKLAKIKKGFDVILIVNRGLKDKDFNETERMINKLFKKAKLIND
ncbi:hypothetical protein AMJ47_03885 [Parcubacteria bacterium DG_72]|nr:MAG: hypothetical protein AMJ47_03885 [Parcubacteria bacterium DG_72]